MTVFAEAKATNDEEHMQLLLVGSARRLKGGVWAAMSSNCGMANHMRAHAPKCATMWF